MIRVITDSVASLPPDLIEKYNIEVATLFLNEDGVETADVSMDLDEFYSRIYDMVDNLPTSSQPSQSSLEDLFERFAKQGDEVLGIWISSGLSGTYEGAVRAARTVASRNIAFSYSMIDTASAGFDQAWPVLAGARAVREGKSLDEASQAVLDSMQRCRFLFSPENLTFLQKGGRIGGAQALLGNLISLAPILSVVDGCADAVAKVRTRKKALAKMTALFEEDIERCGGLKNVVVQYIGDKTPAVEWARDVIEPIVKQAVRVIPVSPVLGLHVGPAVGIAYECEAPLQGKLDGGVAGRICTS